MKNILYKAFMSHAQGHIDKHVANVNVMLEKPVGIGEHPDIIETIVGISMLPWILTPFVIPKDMRGADAPPDFK